MQQIEPEHGIGKLELEFEGITGSFAGEKGHPGVDYSSDLGIYRANVRWIFNYIKNEKTPKYTPYMTKYGKNAKNYENEYFRQKFWQNANLFKI